MVSQWPIPPGHFFDYEVRPDIGDAGTYFYHSHVGFQLSTAHGALIVDDAESEPYHYDHDIILGFGDYYLQNDSAIEAGLLADPFRWSGEPQAVTLGGLSGNASFSNTTADPSCKPYVVDVECATHCRGYALAGGQARTRYGRGDSRHAKGKRAVVTAGMQNGNADIQEAYLMHKLLIFQSFRKDNGTLYSL